MTTPLVMSALEDHFARIADATSPDELEGGWAELWQRMVDALPKVERYRQEILAQLTPSGRKRWPDLLSGRWMTQI